MWNRGRKEEVEVESGGEEMWSRGRKGGVGRGGDVERRMEDGGWKEGRRRGGREMRNGKRVWRLWG